MPAVGFLWGCPPGSSHSFPFLLFGMDVVFKKGENVGVDDFKYKGRLLVAVGAVGNVPRVTVLFTRKSEPSSRGGALEPSAATQGDFIYSLPGVCGIETSPLGHIPGGGEGVTKTPISPKISHIQLDTPYIL